MATIHKLALALMFAFACCAAVHAQAPAMHRAAVPGATLEYELHGSGEPVLLIHGGVMAAAFAPLMTEPALAEQAADAAALLESLGISRAHIVGHSIGGTIAIELAIERPDLVQSLVLLEGGPLPSPRPKGPTPGIDTSGNSGAASPSLPPFAAPFQAGHVELAARTFMEWVAGPDWRVVLKRAGPGAWNQIVGDFPMFVPHEVLGMVPRTVAPDYYARISAPILYVIGTESRLGSPAELRQRAAPLPNAKFLELDGVGHMMQLEQPRIVAHAIAAFIGLHPIVDSQ